MIGADKKILTLSFFYKKIKESMSNKLQDQNERSGRRIKENIKERYLKENYNASLHWTDGYDLMKLMRGSKNNLYPFQSKSERRINTPM